MLLWICGIFKLLNSVCSVKLQMVNKFVMFQKLTFSILTKMKQYVINITRFVTGVAQNTVREQVCYCRTPGQSYLTLPFFAAFLVAKEGITNILWRYRHEFSKRKDRHYYRRR